MNLRTWGEKKEQDQMRNNPTTQMNISEAQSGNDLGHPFCFQTSETSDPRSNLYFIKGNLQAHAHKLAWKCKLLKPLLQPKLQCSKGFHKESSTKMLDRENGSAK